MKTTSIAAVFVAAVAFLSYYTLTAPEAVSEPVSATDLVTLTCSGNESKQALLSILEVYERDGDEAAFLVAEEHIIGGICDFDHPFVSWWSKSYDVPKGLEAFVDATCQQLSNGHCVAIQPVFASDASDTKVIWSGHMLVEPRTTSSVAPTKTAVHRLEQGLILNMNY